MASSTPICGICDLRHIHKPAEIWCSECDEGLCAECTEHHGLSKGTRNHRTIAVREYMSLPANILEIREYCEEHGEKIQLFCTTHDFPCCRLCAVDKHKKCEDVKAIERIIHNAKTSSTFQETEEFITDILETINIIRKNREDHLSSVQEQRRNVEKKILAVRKKINQHLDQIQEKLLNELTEIETNVQDKTIEVLASLNEHEKQLTEYKTTMSSIKQHATDLQTFLSIHRIEREVTNTDKFIHTLLKTDAMNNATLSCQIDNMAQHFPTNVRTLGKITAKSNPCELSIFRRKNKQAQIMLPAKPSRSIENITLKLQQTINTKLKETRGCVLLPDGRMIFSCNIESRVRSINKDGTQDFDTGKLSQRTYDITYIKDTNTIAVTSGGVLFAPQCVRIIDMRSGHIKKTFPVKSYCYGIVYRCNTLIYCAINKGLRMINLNDESESDILVGHISWGAYVATYKDKLYYTNKDTDTVTSCDFHGNILWQFKDESILKDPRGITVDNDGNVYVVSLSFCSVVVISSDGKRRRQLLGTDDGLHKPYTLYYESSSNRLLVANSENVALLFQVNGLL